MTKALRIAIADDERDTREFLQEALPRLGHEVVAVTSSGRQLVEECARTKPDLVISDIKMPELDGIEAARAVNEARPTPFVLLSAYHDDALMGRLTASHFMAYLTKPAKEADLRVAVGLAMLRFQHFLTLAREAADLRQALEDRKVIERAKGIVIRRLRIDEEEAFRRLRKMASDHNRKLVDVAQQIVTAEEVFTGLDRL
jgi:AmiR/NasT family two-component response regulator